MARYTSAYSSFVPRLEEVNTLRKLAKSREKANAVYYANEIDAMCRGSIVLLSSHVEAFIKELGEVALDSFYLKRVQRKNVPAGLFYYISKDKFDEIEDTNDPERIADKVFAFLQRDGHFWSRDDAFPAQIPADRFNRGFSNPAVEKIGKYLGRFGYKSYKSDIKRALKANSNTVLNMMNHLVDTRNNIAHGDPTATKTPSELSDMVELVKIFCRATDDVFASWCRTSFCPIR